MTWNPMTKEMTYEKIGQRHERLPKVNVREVFDAQNRDLLRSILRNAPQGGDLRNRRDKQSNNMSSDMIVLITVTVVLAMGSAICGLLLTILLGLGSWLLVSVNKFGRQMAEVRQFMRDLPCNKCPRDLPNGGGK